jgi:hypothetical protein
MRANKFILAGGRWSPAPTRGVAAMLTCAGWILQRLPGQVLEEQRAELIKALASANDLVVEVHCRPAVVLIRDGDRALVRMPSREDRPGGRNRPGQPSKLNVANRIRSRKESAYPANGRLQALFDRLEHIFQEK